MNPPSVRRRRAPRTAYGLLLCAATACSSPGEQPGHQTSHVGGGDEIAQLKARADTLAATCPTSGRRGSVLVARPDPAEEESGITFKILGDGAGPGVVLCRDVLYADAAALLGLMGEQSTVEFDGASAIVDGRATDIRGYRYHGAIYVDVRAFARNRRALLVPSPMDVTIWPSATLAHMKSAGMTTGPAYEAAVREGLVPE
jgi:hypothetical protein